MDGCKLCPSLNGLAARTDTVRIRVSWTIGCAWIVDWETDLADWHGVGGTLEEAIAKAVGESKQGQLATATQSN